MLRFKPDLDSNCFKVYAKRKSTGKWEQIGTCHFAAVADIKAGKHELIQFNLTAKGGNNE
jgi:hypothetical protein